MNEYLIINVSSFTVARRYGSFQNTVESVFNNRRKSADVSHNSN